MRPISVHVEEAEYRRLKAIAAAEGRPVAALVRQAMSDYVRRRGRTQRSVLDIPAHSSGKLLRPWDRAEIYDEMVDGR